VNEYLQWAALTTMAGGLAGTWWGLGKYGNQLNEALEVVLEARGLLDAEARRKDAHTKAFEALSDADKIAEEMERSAEATEMRIARRTTLPREDAGPPAKVYRPKLRKRYPKSWPR
jgi:hypothetical protein